MRVVLAVVLALVVAPAAGAATLTVDAGSDRRAISPDIYGMNFADPALAAEIGLPVNRFGGNTTDTYNWNLGSWNTGNDWYFENIATCWDEAHGYCGNPATHAARDHAEHIDGDRARGTRTLLTLPMMGWVAKDNPVTRPTCAFPRSRFPAQQGFDPYWTDCGNGKDAAGNNLTAVKTDAGVQIDPAANATAWIPSLGGKVSLFELGNEPMLWNSTHRHWHPEAATYDELKAKSVALAGAAKTAAPSAQTLGPSEWGWTNYFCSAADYTWDGCSASDTDRAAHGGKELTAWYLEQMRVASEQQGRRLLDYLDLHYYAQGGNTPDITRSLWDPTYTDPSWIGTQVALIPRMKQWIAQNYPGTKIALTEYDLTNGPDDITNTIIQADTLGIFAREGVDLAARWAPPAKGAMEADAWRIFRNYDGSGGRFGDTWVRSQSSDQAAVAVYGAQRADGTLTVLAINKSAAPQTADVELRGFTAGATAQTWRWVGAGGISRQGDQSVSGGRFTAVVPGRSMTLWVVPKASTPGGGGGVPLPPLPLPPVVQAMLPAPQRVAAPPRGGSAVAGRRTCTMPRLRGATLRGARRRLARARCAAPKVVRRRASRRRRGRVVAQAPPAGTQAAAVRLVVGRR